MKTWKIKTVSRGLHWNRIVAGNGEIVFSSQVYFSKSNCRRAARRAAAMLDIEWEDK